MNGGTETIVEQAIACARGGTPTVLDIEGHAGFGKTHLIRGIVEGFSRAQVLRATAYEDTQNDQLGVLRQLGVDVHGISPNALSASQAIMRRIDALDADELAVLVVDDLHWADPESIDALGVLMERLAGDRVLLVTAHRPVGSRHTRWQSRLLHLASVGRVVLDGLDEDEMASLLQEGADDASKVTEELLGALRVHTGGSPLFLRSLLHEYRVDELRAYAERNELPATSEIVSAMGERLARLDPAAVATLSAIAVIGGGGADEFMLRTVADLPDVSTALEVLTRDRLVVLDRAGATVRARIFHGVVQAAIYDNIPTATRKRMHAAAAARCVSSEDRLRHRVAAANRADDGLAADLSAFADALHESGRYREAARLRREAARCSSTAEDASCHIREADVESILALDFDEVSFDEHAIPVEAAERFITGLSLAAQKRFVAASDRLDSLTDAELEVFRPVDAYRARVLRAWSLVAAGRSPHAALRDLALAHALPNQDPAVRGFASMAQGQAEQRTTPLGDGTTLAELLSADRAQLLSGNQGAAALAWRGSVLALTGMPEEAIGDLSLVTSRFSEGQMDFGDGLFHGLQGFSHFLNGEWPRAAMMIGLSRAARTRYAAPLTTSIAPLASVVAGDAAGALAGLREARRLRIESPHPAAVHAGDIVEILTLWFMGEERERAAWLGARIRDLGSPEDWADEQVPHLWYLAQAVGAQWADRPESATRWIELLRTVDSTPWSDVAAEWLEARTDPSFDGGERLRRIADGGLAGLPTLTMLLRHDAARTELENLRRLRATATGLRELGADLLASRLSATVEDDEPIARSLFAELSDRERDVAALLLEGLSYAQIARELFITRSTVSFHLSRIYAKTGTGSRHELIEAVRRTGD